MTDGKDRTGLGSTQPASPVSEPPRRGLGERPPPAYPPEPPAAPQGAKRGGLGAFAPPPAPPKGMPVADERNVPGPSTFPPPPVQSSTASSPPGSPLRGDSLGPLPGMVRLTVEKIGPWISSDPPDHLAFLDIPRSHRFVVSLGELKLRAKQRREYLEHWEGGNDQERQTAAVAARKQLAQLDEVLATEESLARYHYEFGKARLLSQTQEYYDNDGQIDESEYQTLRNSADFWRIDQETLLAVIRSVVAGFEPPRPKPSVPAPSPIKTWTPLVGRFRSTPASLTELLDAMAQEIPAAQELLFDKMLSFYLSQQGAIKLVQTADRVVRDYDRRETLGVWDFLWSSGYRYIHLVGLQPVATLQALVGACLGRTEPLQDAIRNGQLGLWAEKVLVAPDLAALVKTYRNAAPKELREAARRALWHAGDRRLQLASGPVVSTMDELRQAMLLDEKHAKAAVAEARSGALEQWLIGIGMKSLAGPLKTITDGRSDTFLQYSLIWATGTFHALPVWQGAFPTMFLEAPARIDTLTYPQVATLLPLLDEGVLPAWAMFVRHDETLRQNWEHVRESFRASPLALRVATLRWSVGAEGVLSTLGLIRSLPELFTAFETRPDVVEQLFVEGVLDAWRVRASLTFNALASRVTELPQSVRTRAFLWCLGYPTLQVGSSRISTLADLAALPDSEQQALQSLIDAGVLSFWRDVLWVGAPSLSAPLDSEHALLAVGAAPATLSVSPERLDLGVVPESSVQRMQLELRALGGRGRITATLTGDSERITAESDGRNSTEDSPLVVGPLWAAGAGTVSVNVGVEIAPGKPPGGLITISHSNGGTPICVPVTWTPKFPTGALLGSGAIGLLSGLTSAALVRLLLSIAVNSVLYYRPNTYFGDTRVRMVARDLSLATATEIWKAGAIPGILLGVVLSWIAFGAVQSGPNPDNAPPVGCVTLVIGGPLVALATGYFITYFCSGIDAVGHRFRSILELNIDLDVSAILGWSFVFSTLGLATGMARVLKRQDRVWVARAVMAAPFILFALLLR